VLGQLRKSQREQLIILVRMREVWREVLLSLGLFPTENDPNNAQETIIIVSENMIFWQGSNLLEDKLLPFYSTPSKVSGIALDVRKKLMFVAEDDGCVYQSSLDIEEPGEKRQVICQNVLNAKPLLLSVDWLNAQLYIMGEILSPHHKTFSISRCDFEGRKPVVAVGGLTGKPVHIEVDPYNGYLFWVIPNEDVDSGLYRLDLGEISNGIKHESHPYQMIKGKNLGAFMVDHTRFHLLVPMQNENTVISVSLNGKNEEDIRKNTQSPLLHTVLSLAMVKNEFIWTNGREILKEEFHNTHHIYYHNSKVPKDINSSLIAICVNSSLSQPIPIPVNPPHNCQALLGSTRAKVSWQIPQLVGDQGKGAFKVSLLHFPSIKC
jgi:proto-oncogene tyrosine-protein kinase ROS